MAKVKKVKEVSKTCPHCYGTGKDGGRGQDPCLHCKPLNKKEVK